MSVVLIGRDVDADGLYLNVTAVHKFDRTAVMDGPNFLYWRHVVSLDCVFNVGTQQEELVGKARTYLQGLPHQLPPTNPARPAPIGPLISRKLPPHSGTPDYRRPAAYTCRAIEALLQPRVRFHWATDFQTLLLSPTEGYSTDATGGPVYSNVEVVEALSGKTFVLRFTVQTDLAPGEEYSVRPHGVLSHSFAQEETLDQDFRKILVTRGTVTFSSAVLRTAGVAGAGTFQADDYRDDIFLPVPFNMKREKIVTRVDPSGLVVTYEVVDRERYLNLNAVGITRIEGVHVIENSLPAFAFPKSTPVFGGLSAPHIAARVNSGLGALADQVAGAMEKLGMLGGGPLKRPSLALAPVTGVGLLTSDLAGAVCTSKHVVQVRGWGHMGTERNDIEVYLRAIITERIKPLRVGMAPITTKSTATHSIEDGWVQLEEHYIAGPLRPFGGVVPTLGIGGNKLFGANAETNNLVVGDPNVDNQGPPGLGGNRGTLPQIIVSNALNFPWNPGANLPPDEPGASRFSDLLVPDPPAWPRPAGV